MKICALTMVYRDYWALSQWYAHYSRHLGAENLYVIAHGADPEIQRICPEASVITIPRDQLDGFDRIRERMLNGIHSGLGHIYDRVIRTDADELICLDPELYKDFGDLFAKQPANALFALGLNLAETTTDADCDPDIPILKQRSSAVFTTGYSKAWTAGLRAGLRQHGVTVRPRLIDRFPFVLPRGVYLVHLKYANTRALSASFAHRREMALTPGKGRPGTAWKDPNENSRRFFRQLDTLPELPWVEASALAHENYSREPLRDRRYDVIRVRRDQPKYRTVLPDWFQDA